MKLRVGYDVGILPDPSRRGRTQPSADGNTTLLKVRNLSFRLRGTGLGRRHRFRLLRLLLEIPNFSS
jgi:hypothetical protein